MTSIHVSAQPLTLTLKPAGWAAVLWKSYGLHSHSYLDLIALKPSQLGVLQAELTRTVFARGGTNCRDQSAASSRGGRASRYSPLQIRRGTFFFGIECAYRSPVRLTQGTSWLSVNRFIINHKQTDSTVLCNSETRESELNISRRYFAARRLE